MNKVVPARPETEINHRSSSSSSSDLEEEPFYGGLGCHHTGTSSSRRPTRARAGGCGVRAREEAAEARRCSRRQIVLAGGAICPEKNSRGGKTRSSLSLSLRHQLSVWCVVVVVEEEEEERHFLVRA